MSCPRYALATRGGGEGRWSEPLTQSFLMLDAMVRSSGKPGIGKACPPNVGMDEEKWDEGYLSSHLLHEAISRCSLPVSGL
jgi:hypothetical protein